MQHNITRCTIQQKFSAHPSLAVFYHSHISYIPHSYTSQASIDSRRQQRLTDLHFVTHSALEVSKTPNEHNEKKKQPHFCQSLKYRLLVDNNEGHNKAYLVSSGSIPTAAVINKVCVVPNFDTSVFLRYWLNYGKKSLRIVSHLRYLQRV